MTNWFTHPTSPDAEPLWEPTSTRRGTVDLVSMCFFTLILCTWTALHMNIPPPHVRFAPSPPYFTIKAWWMISSLIGPDETLWVSLNQYLAARRFCKILEIMRNMPARGRIGVEELYHGAWGGLEDLTANVDADPQALKGDPYQTLLQLPPPPGDGGFFSGIKRRYRSIIPKDLVVGFYIVMGGYELIETPSFGQPRTYHGTLTANGALRLASAGLLPPTTVEQIMDKSKADGLAKVLVCIQALWLVVQCIGRAVQGLPITLLELNTALHVAFALLTYLFLLRKPQGVLVPTDIWATETVKACLSVPQVGGGYFLPYGVPYAPTDTVDSSMVNYEDSDRSIALNTPAYYLISFIQSMIYGGVHLVAWNWEFPTNIERLLWRVGGCALVVEGPLRAFGVYSWVRRSEFTLLKTFILLLGFATLVSRLFRVFMVVEAFASIRRLPKGAYTTVSWAEMFPHI